MAYALRALSMRELSEAELREKLSRRGFPEDLCETVLQTLRGYGYVSDTELAHSLARRRGVGRRRIAADMRRRGVPEALGQEVLQERSEDTEAQEAAALLEKHRSRALRAKNPRANAYAYLARRGFESGTIMAALQGAGWLSGEEEDWEAE